MYGKTYSVSVYAPPNNYNIGIIKSLQMDYTVFVSITFVFTGELKKTLSASLTF